MAARRLVAVLVVMLVVSTIAAILVPAPRRPIGSGSTTTTATTKTKTTNEQETGKLVTATMSTAHRRPPVKLRVGDELRLRVKSIRSDQVKVGGFGLVEAVDQSAPALFDVFADHIGRFDVELVNSGKSVGGIVIRRRR
jgi:hypothetical protein